MGGLRLFWFAAFAMLAAAIPPPARADCPAEPAPATAESQAFYADKQGSVVDPQKLRANLALIAPIRRFVTEASLRVDSEDRGAQACAESLMLSWAKARALLQEPKDFAGMRERQRFAIALDIIALKLRARGLDIAPLLDWLQQLDRGVIQDFARRDRTDNLQVWSAVNAASFAILKADPEARAYQDRVWRQAVATIRPDGYIDTEIARGGRALIYHAYYLSALLTLEPFRRALGEPPSSADRAALQRLAERVGGSLCDPAAITTAAGGVPQEGVPALQLSPIVAFGDLAGPRPYRCAPGEIPRGDPVMGGDLGRTAQILLHVRR